MQALWRSVEGRTRCRNLVPARELSVAQRLYPYNSKLALEGQHSSIEAGSPFRSLIDHGATTHSIHQIIRQQNSIQRQAVELIASGNGTVALEHLNKNGYVT